MLNLSDLCLQCLSLIHFAFFLKKTPLFEKANKNVRQNIQFIDVASITQVTHVHNKHSNNQRKSPYVIKVKELLLRAILVIDIPKYVGWG